MTETRTRVRQCIRRAFDLADVPLWASPSNVGAWDSLGHVMLMAELEREFGVQFPADEILKNTSENELVALVERTVTNG